MIMLVNSAPRSTVDDSRLAGEILPAEPVPAEFRTKFPADVVAAQAFPERALSADELAKVATGS